MMIMFSCDLGKVRLEFTRYPSGPLAERVEFRAIERGEHQDDPKHKYYKPDVVVSGTMHLDSLREMIQCLDKLV